MTTLPAPDHAGLTLRDLLNSVDELHSSDLDTHLELVELHGGDVLFEEGDPGDGMYVVVAGMLGVRVKQPDGSELVIDKLAPGAKVGELALLSGQPRTATVYAINDAGLIHLTRDDFEQLDPEAQTELTAKDTTALERWQRLLLARVLGRLLGELDAPTLDLLQERLIWHRLGNGGVLVHQGAPAESMFIVVNGRLRIAVTTHDGETQIVGEVGPGETVGEYALLTDEPRSATVYAVRSTNVVEMTRPVFEQLARERPELMGRVARIIVERRQRSLKNRVYSAVCSVNIALLPASPTVDTRAFAADLAAALERFGGPLVLDGAAFDAQYGHAGAAQTPSEAPENAAIAAWLNELETKHSFLLLAADAEPSAWTRRCIDQADRVLIVANPGEDPAPGEVEQLLGRLEVPVRAELVLWHPPQTEQPQGTLPWLEARDANPGMHAHHHVRRGDTAHMGRLARRLTGEAVVLVLSGGSARGFAHLGVYQAMEELGIPVDYVAATSMGSVMGAAIVAFGKSDEIMRLSAQFANPKAIFDRTLPLASLMASEKVTALLQRLLGDRRIEDLWIPFFCVATNITTAEARVYQRGPLWSAVRASLAIPGVFAPVIEDGDTIVDGSIMDHFPVARAAAVTESHRLVGVNVSPFHEKKRYYDYETGISGWRLFFSRVNPLRKPLRAPAILGTLFRAMEINSVRLSKESETYTDLLVEPEIKGIGMMDYAKYKEIAQAGYDAAIEPLREWKATRGL